jgi:F-type H+-transporting ATPase subunit epsilon
MSFHADITTPMGKIFDADIDALKAPGSEGEFGILGGHAPLLAGLKSGVLKLSTPGGREVFLGIGAGILEVDAAHNVLVLCDKAINGESYAQAKKLSEEFEKK